MAVIIPSLGELKGSIGGNTFQRNRSGQIVRARPRVGKKSTAKQSSAHNNLSHWLYMWQLIGETSRGLWNTYANTWTKGNRYGATKTLSGGNWFMSVNETGRLATNTYYADPPPHTLPADVPTFSVVIVDDTILMNIDSSFDYANNALLIYTTLPTSRSSTSINRIRKFMTNVQSDQGAYWDITSLWESATGLQFNASTAFPLSNIFFSMISVAIESSISSTEVVVKSNVAEGPVYDSDMLDYISYFSTPPTLARKLLLNDLFIGLKADGNFAEGDRLWLFASEKEQQSTISLMNPSSTPLDANGSYTWDSGGYKGDGSSAYINTHFNPSSDNITFEQDSASIILYSKTPTLENKKDFGVNDGTAFLDGQIARASNLANVSINCNGFLSVDVATGDGAGTIAFVRPSLLFINYYRNGVSISNYSQVSSAIPNDLIYILANNAGGSAERFSSRYLAYCFIGSSAVDQATFHNRLLAYLTAIGEE